MGGQSQSCFAFFSLASAFTPGSAQRLNDGQFELHLTSGDGARRLIQVSSGFIQWTNLSTNKTTGASMTFRDAEAANFEHLFYRALLENAP